MEDPSTTSDEPDPVAAFDLPRAVAVPLSLLADTSPHLGVFSTANAHSRGLSDEVLRGLVRSGVLIRATRGWYHVADASLDRRDLHRRAAAAHVLRHGGTAVASHHSALTEHEIRTLAPDLTTVHLTYRHSSSYRAGPGWVAHRADVSTREVELDQAAKAVTVPFAVIQTGLIGGALATLVAGDHALARKLTTADELARAARAYRHAEGISAVMKILPELNAGSESPAESLARYAVRQLGYDVAVQREVTAEGRDYRVDLAIEGTTLVIEVDGKIKYEENPEETVLAEKARHSCLERSDLTVLRLTWREIITPAGRLRLDNIRKLIEAKLRAPAA